ncbi:MAG: NAD(P)-dependent oxidoreductase [Methylotenera sp.]|nr:NAD(P)-dependent oxidoreductase [Methylotenera sp.]
MINISVTPHLSPVVVIGASGFIGEHLLSVLSERGGIEVRVLVHRNSAKSYTNIKFIEGDLLKPGSLDVLLVENCTVFNLAYLAESNLEATTNLAMACSKNKVRRLIHCSTAVVAGNVTNNLVNESATCFPISEYEKTKLKIEAILLEASVGKFEVTVLRPTAVFGPGGKNLLKLANDLINVNPWVNYIRSCILGRRGMNLVCVENVVAALLFLMDAENVDREVFIISDDDSVINNYRDIESILLKCFEKSYLIPRIYVPAIVLSGLFSLIGKLNSKPFVKYSDQKLAAYGFKKHRTLVAGVHAFAMWYKFEFKESQNNLN